MKIYISIILFFCVTFLNAQDIKIAKIDSIVNSKISEKDPALFVGIIKDGFYYEKTNISKKASLFSLQTNNIVKDIKFERPNITQKMDSLLSAYYHTTKYLYFNNKKISK